MRRELASVAAFVAALTTVTSTPTAASSAPVRSARDVPTVHVRPTAYDRGPHLAGPHVDGRVLHDGAMRMTFRAPHVTFLGRLGDRYVVHLASRKYARMEVRWIRADESQRVLSRGLSAAEVRLSDDGRQLYAFPGVSSHRTTVSVIGVRGGRELASRTFHGAVSVLDASDGRALIGGWAPARTFWWDRRADTVRRVAPATGYAADISSDRLATYDADPYAGGCSVLSTIDGVPLSRMCDSRIVAMSSDGSRLATVGILEDGIGPAELMLRDDAGDPLVRYRASAYVGRIGFGPDTAEQVVFDAYGSRRWATVRCESATCDRLSAVHRSPIR